MSYWLLKSEASCYSIDDMKRDKKVSWEGIRNYQARNFMREMKVGDLCFFYHSSDKETGVYGVVKVVAEAHVDESQFKKSDEHFDPKATTEKPIWQCVDVAFVEKFKSPISLSEIKHDPKLSGIVVAEQGSRLSVQPVSPTHFEHILQLAHKK